MALLYSYSMVFVMSSHPMKRQQQQSVCIGSKVAYDLKVEQQNLKQGWAKIGNRSLNGHKQCQKHKGWNNMARMAQTDSDGVEMC